MSSYDEKPVMNNLRLEDYPIHKEKEYVRPRMDYLREFEISIRFLSLGCLF
jgi:hypothetical protein